MLSIRGTACKWSSLSTSAMLFPFINFFFKKVDAVSENLVQPIHCGPDVGKEFLSWCPQLARDFSNFEFVPTDEEMGSGRARFVMNTHTKNLYKEDGEVGDLWIHGMCRT